MRDRFHATEPRAQMLRFHAQTAGSTLTAQQPDNNVVRVALQAMAAVLGGAQSLHTNSRDEALALPTEESVQIALRTQQIIAYETGVTKSVDPVGGAYAIEALTQAIVERAQAYIAQIDAMGGAVRAIELGFPQREIQHSAYRYQQEIEARSRLVVGVNVQTHEDESAPPLWRLDPDLERQQVRRVQALRAQRQNAQVQSVLQRLEQAARGSTNLMPLLIEAVECYATLGEIADTLRGVFGEHQEQIVLSEA
jgi:methylmalonyl-CoA mutase N-terminal domain/subunit